MRPLLLAAIAALAVAAPALAADPVEGDWLVQNHEARIRIGPCPTLPEDLCGVIDWLRAPTDAAGAPKRDVHNPNPALRSRPLMGLTLIWDFRRDAAGRWGEGKIYDPKSGKTYDSKLDLNSDGTLKVSGCVLMFCQTQTWKRVS